ncbi:MAG: trehalase family glycosidase [Lentisphaeria bacterium]
MMDEKILNIWNPGHILAYSGIDGETDFNNGIVMRTSFKDYGFDIRLPLEGENILFKSKLVADNNFMLAGDFFVAKGLKMVFLDAWNLLLEGEFEVHPGHSIEIITEGNRTLIGSKGFLRAELITADIDKRIDVNINKIKSYPIPEMSSPVAKKALTKAYSQLRTMFYSPTGEIKHRWSTPDRWPHRNMWLWDSVFHSIGIRHLDPELARDALLAVFDLQREDGFIPLCGCPGYKTIMTQPPVLALGIKLLNDVSPSKELIAESYPKLKAYLEWDLNHRDTDGAGLLEWLVEGSETCRSGESGMDNSPRFDLATQLDATDFNSFISLECEIMSGFAAQLGLEDDGALWEERHHKLNRLLNERLWNDKKEFYCDYDVTRNKMSDVMASTGFLPLICGAASPQQAEFLAKQLDNPDTFKTALPVASIALCNREYYSKDMWRGPVWANVNWLIAYGFRRYKMNDVADMIIDKSVKEIEKMYLKYGTFFEFYDDRCEVDPPDLYRKANKIPDSYHQAFHDYGWTAMLYIDMILNKDKKNC